MRPLTLLVGGASKAVFIGLVLAQGRRYLDDQVAVALAIDAMMITLFAWYLFASRKSTHQPRPQSSDFRR